MLTDNYQKYFILIVTRVDRSYIFYRHLNIKKNQYNVRLLGDENNDQKETPTTQGIELSKTTLKNNNNSQISIDTIQLNGNVSNEDTIRIKNDNNNQNINNINETKSIKIMNIQNQNKKQHVKSVSTSTNLTIPSHTSTNSSFIKDKKIPLGSLWDDIYSYKKN